MGHQVTLGGERLGAGKRQKIELHNYERSTHDIGFVWRSTMASGTLVPFMSELATPGDTFDIDLNLDVLTHPTIGPLFGTYKVQLDVFQIPIRLYQGQLHMNMLGIGLDMSKVLLPQINLTAPKIDPAKPIDNQQMNPSHIFSYLGIRGAGWDTQTTPGTEVIRKFNAVPWLGYWDIYKNYYANKQEEIGYVIHKDPTDQIIAPQQMVLLDGVPDNVIVPVNPVPPYTYQQVQITSELRCQLAINGLTQSTDLSSLICHIQISPVIQTNWPVPITELFSNWVIDPPNNQAIGTVPTGLLIVGNVIGFGALTYSGQPEEFDTEPEAFEFPLDSIDEMRKRLLAHLDGTFIYVNDLGIPPYNLPLQNAVIGAGPAKRYSQLFSQEGLALKTYNSDLFNNWIQTEWIDGPDGISAVTAIDTSGGSFTIDELNLSRKVYDMLNRIAISGGSYDDWLDAVYLHQRQRSAENPMYLGGLIQNLVFQEVISNAQTTNQPLGTLAGRGTLGSKRKGGHIIAKIDEPSYIMGIVSITPNIDYSQGNKWDVNLQTLNDLHKPALDQIGFQDLITDQMAWWDTTVNNSVSTDPTFKSAGKQPAWINYMTNVNVVRGNFADQTQQMFMVLNRRYEPQYGGVPTILDLTTYIDPTKFNHIFADTRRDAQNFWAQIGVKITARRKMSAKVMPNL